MELVVCKFAKYCLLIVEKHDSLSLCNKIWHAIWLLTLNSIELQSHGAQIEGFSSLSFDPN